jgi:glutamine amidotransferase
MITIIDYGLGNIQAFINVYKKLHISVTVAQKSDDLKGATKLILPGVGAFDHAMQRLDDSGMRQELDNLVLNQKIPVLGICVGMQMFADASDEGMLPGLGWITGRVRAFNSLSEISNLPLPHMGWNDLNFDGDFRLFSGLDNKAYFYFLHSYFFECQRHENSIGTTSYGRTFTSAVAIDNIYGVQFHPEKSHHSGVTLLKNFSEL